MIEKNELLAIEQESIRSMNIYESIPKEKILKDFSKLLDLNPKTQHYTKFHADRQKYQTLLNHFCSSLQEITQALKSSKISNAQAISQEQLLLLSCFQKFTENLYEQCEQKGIISEIFLKHQLSLQFRMSEYIDEVMHNSLKERVEHDESVQSQYERIIGELKNQIVTLGTEKDKKWRNLFMLIKDNRVLRRTRGKLAREVHASILNKKSLEEKICELTWEIQRYKLLMSEEYTKQTIGKWMRNMGSLMKFEKHLKKYPRKAKRVLEYQLESLEIDELQSLPQKMEYVMRQIEEAKELVDYYEDMDDLIAPSKLLLNVAIQTEVQYASFGVNTNTTKAYSKYCQTNVNQLSKKNLKIDSSVSSFRQDPNKTTNNGATLRRKESESKMGASINMGHERGVERKRSPVFLKINKYLDETIMPRYYHKQSSFVFRSCGFRKKLEIDSDVLEAIYNPDQKDKYSLKDSKKSPTMAARRNKSMVASKGQGGLLGFKALPSRPRMSQKQMRRSGAKVYRQSNFLTVGSEVADSSSVKDGERMSMTIAAFHSIDEEQEHSKLSSSSSITEQLIIDEAYEGRSKRKLISHRAYTSSRFQQMKRKGDRSSYVADCQAMKPPTLDRKLSNTSQKLQNITSKVNNSATPISSQVSNVSNFFLEHSSSSNKLEDIKRINRQSSIVNPINIQDNSRNMKTDESMSEINQSVCSFSQQNQSIGGLSSSKNWDAKKPIFSSKKKTDNINSHMRSSLGNKSHLLPPSKVARLSTQNQYKNYPILPNQLRKDLFQSRKIIQSNLQEELPQPESNLLKKKITDNHDSNNKISSYYFIDTEIQMLDVNKIIKKLIHLMFVHRNQLRTSNKTLIDFLLPNMKNLYGTNSQVHFSSFTRSLALLEQKHSPICQCFRLLLNVNVPTVYLSDIFKVYLILLQKCANQTLIMEREAGLRIIKYTSSIFYSEQTQINDITKDLIYIFEPKINLNSFFITLEAHLRRDAIETQFYQFCRQILPPNETDLTYLQLLEITSFLNPSVDLDIHLSRIRYYSRFKGTSSQQTPGTSIQGGMKVHKISLYSTRQKWSQIRNIVSQISRSYEANFGDFKINELISWFNITIQDRKPSNKGANVGISHFGLNTAIQSVNTPKNYLIQQVNSSQILNSRSNIVKKTNTVKQDLFEECPWLIRVASNQIDNHYQYNTPVSQTLLKLLKLVDLSTRINQLGIFPLQLQFLAEKTRKLMMKRQNEREGMKGESKLASVPSQKVG